MQYGGRETVMTDEEMVSCADRTFKGKIGSYGTAPGMGRFAEMEKR